MMKNFLILFILVSLMASVSCQSDERGPRLMILAGMGNELDISWRYYDIHIILEIMDQNKNASLWDYR